MKNKDVLLIAAGIALVWYLTKNKTAAPAATGYFPPGTTAADFAPGTIFDPTTGNLIDTPQAPESPTPFTIQPSPDMLVAGYQGFYYG